MKEKQISQLWYNVLTYKFRDLLESCPTWYMHLSVPESTYKKYIHQMQLLDMRMVLLISEDKLKISNFIVFHFYTALFSIYHIFGKCCFESNKDILKSTSISLRKKSFQLKIIGFS